LKRALVFVILSLIVSVPLASQEGDDAQRAVAFPSHALGDQSLGIGAGLFIPLFFQDFTGGYHGTNLSLGATGDFQWNAYLSANWKMGLELAVGFCFSPNLHTLLMLPITFKVTYLITTQRFEFPLFIGAGINVVRYREWSHLDIIVKPGFGVFWRYDHNWSFGGTISWWLDFQYVDANVQPVDQARMGNFLSITPSLIYNF
jgi:hypothetical protein